MTQLTQRSFMNRIAKIFLALICAQAPQIWAAGTEGGNTGLLTNLKLKFESKHPEQDYLVRLINKADLPVVLREAILNDLKTTSILMSSEEILYKDLQKQLRLELSKITREVQKTPDGRETETVREEWTVQEQASRLGIYMHSWDNLKVDNIDSAPVAAVTQSNPRRVYYFTNVLAKMPVEDVRKLVLHEQAHRLVEIFGKRAGEERFVEAWASSLLAYLEGQMSRSDFFNILKTNGVSTASITDPEFNCDDQPCFTTESFNGQAFSATITIPISASDLGWHGLDGTNSLYQVEVLSSSFANIAPLKTRDRWIVNVGTVRAPTVLRWGGLVLVENPKIYLDAAFQNMGRYLRDIKSSATSTSLINFEVQYQKRAIEIAGQRRTQIEIQGVNFAPEKRTDQSAHELTTRLERVFSGTRQSVLFSETSQWALTAPSGGSWGQKTFSNSLEVIAAYLEGLKFRDLDAFEYWAEFLKLWFFELGETCSLSPHPQSGGYQMIVKLTNSTCMLSNDDLDKVFLDPRYINSDTKALVRAKRSFKTINKQIRSEYGFDFKIEGTNSVQEYAAVEEFLLSSDSVNFLRHFALFAKSYGLREPLVIGLNVRSNDSRIQIAWNSSHSAKNMPLHLSVPTKFLARFRGAFARILSETVMNPKTWSSECSSSLNKSKYCYPSELRTDDSGHSQWTPGSDGWDNGSEDVYQALVQSAPAPTDQPPTRRRK
jgi:hypothetical protein